MLFTIIYHWKPDATEEETRRLRSLFLAWEPPEGMDILSHYFFASGGGVVIAEVESAGAIWKALAPFTPLLQLEVEASLNVMDAIAMSIDAEEWVATVPRS